MIKTSPRGRRCNGAGARIVLLLALVITGGCASVDFDYPKTDTRALTDTAGTAWGSNVAPLVTAHPDLSGFHLLTDGIDALAARLLLAKGAERSLDAQYYLITNDDIGLLFIGALLQAADRGVRVRLLLDDIQTKGYDAGMAALDSLPNFEVRIFNPFAGRSSRIGDSLGDFSRINRRMHNKSFTVDNQITIIGGRNIADEYFAAREDVNFGDVDVLGIGPVVNDVSAMFDTYWNDVAAVPVPAFARMPDDPAAALLRLRARIDEVRTRLADSVYAESLRADVSRYLDSDGSMFTWAPYILAYDAPDKARKRNGEQPARSIVATLAEAVERAERELLVVSPYFVPRESGLTFFRQLRERGVKVSIITNSLAATNHSIVHSGYAPSRKSLLEMGVRIFEMKYNVPPAGVERGGKGAPLATLHTKAFLVDREELFIGSFNWDPRSVNINTELGVIIQSAQLGASVGTLVDEHLNERAYEVVLNDRGKLRWIDRGGPCPVIVDKEPGAGFWRRFNAQAMRILPIRGQL